MDIILAILAIICVVGGVVGSVVPVIPGPPIAYLGLLLAHWSKYASFSTEFLVIWAVVTVAVTILDYFLPSWFAKRFGGSKQASRGAMIGTIAGMFFGPAGILIGPFAGALIGEFLFDRKNSARAFKVAMGSFLAFFFGTGMKLIVSCFMAFYAIKGIFF